MTKPIGQRIRDMIQYRLQSLWTAVPGIIVDINHTTLRCQVKVKLTMEFDNGEIRKTPIIADVPIAFQKGKDAVVIPDYAVGDVVLLVFSRYALDKLLIDKDIRDPVFKRQFTIDDAIIVGGFFTEDDTIPQKDEERDFTILRKTDNGISQIILKENGDIVIKIASGNLQIEGTKVYLNCDASTGKGVCRIGDKDSRGDTMIEGSNTVYAG